MANKTLNNKGAWQGTETQSAQHKVYSFNTSNKFIDKDIQLTVDVQDGTGSLTGGNVISSISTTDTTYLTDDADGGVGPVTFTSSAYREGVTYVPGTAGWIDSAADVTGLEQSATNTQTSTKYIKKGSASIKSGQSIPVTGTITRSGKTLTASASGSNTIKNSFTSGWINGASDATVSASGTFSVDATTLDSNLNANNIVNGVTIFGVAGTATGSSIEGNATLSNKATTGITYTDTSSSAPVLVSGDYLYINGGYIANQKISLAQLVPDNATISSSTLNLLYKTQTAYDSSGTLLTGTMQDASVKSGSVNINNEWINVADEVIHTHTDGINYYNVDISAYASKPEVLANGYITSTIGTKNDSSENSFSIPVAVATVGLVKSGDFSAGDGSASITTNGYYDGTTISSTDTITLSNIAAAGYYKITTSGYGKVNVPEISLDITSSNEEGKHEGYIKSQNLGEGISATTLFSKTGTKDYYIKKSTGTSTTLTPKKTSQTYTLSAGYYPTDRIITVSQVTPTDTTQVDKGSLNISSSVISAINAVEGTPTSDTKNWLYNIPLTLSASGTASVKVSTNGYVSSADNNSQAISKTSSATVQLSLYNGSYTVGDS